MPTPFNTSAVVACADLEGSSAGLEAMIEDLVDEYWSLWIPPSEASPGSPSIGVVIPTSSETYITCAATLTFSGTCVSGDNALSSVTWSNDRGGGGTASGVGTWAQANITLYAGENVLTLRGYDTLQNYDESTCVVFYIPADTTDPSVQITGPTSDATYSTGQSAVNIDGTASDNVRVTSVTWGNNRGGGGNATGTAAWHADSITLLSGSNVITVTAYDAANNSSQDTLTIEYTPPDTTAPVVVITSPTSATTYESEVSTLNMAGTASDAVGIDVVTWENNRGGGGTAVGTTNWTITGIPLYDGTNVITVTARDVANNSGTDTITATYDAPSTPAGYHYEVTYVPITGTVSRRVTTLVAD